MLRVSHDMRDLDLITCIVQRGKADAVWAAARNAGAGGATIFFARGTGVRERLGFLGVAIMPEKEVIMVVSHPGATERIFQAIVKAGQLNLAGQGIAYVQKINRCAGLVASVPRPRKAKRKR